MHNPNKNNNHKIKIFFSSSLIGIVIAVWCSQAVGHQVTSRSNIIASKQINAPTLNKKVLSLALTAYTNAKQAGYSKSNYLTIIDYSMPSTAPRLWVVDLQSQTVIYHTHVAHGIGSGENYAHKFSNQPGSGMSSLGLYLTGEMYQGYYGRSLKLHGLDGKFNSNALARKIVMHKAHYVDQSIINKIGRLGRSLGCLALNTKIADNIMRTIKDGSLIFCYYPDEVWLKESTTLNANKSL